VDELRILGFVQELNINFEGHTWRAVSDPLTALWVRPYSVGAALKRETTYVR